MEIIPVSLIGDSFLFRHLQDIQLLFGLFQIPGREVFLDFLIFEETSVAETVNTLNTLSLFLEILYNPLNLGQIIADRHINHQRNIELDDRLHAFLDDFFSLVYFILRRLYYQFVVNLQKYYGVQFFFM